tara:strand:+ start:1085 stop:2506 length:1422 start_codon:yes stop_codon:yes gene_type:complete
MNNINKIIIMFFIIGCATQKAIDPEIVLDSQIPESWESNISITPNISEIWWNEFQDEYLNQFLSAFLDNNINLEQAMLNTRIAKQASVISTANLAPSIGIGLSATESEQNTAGFPPIFSSFFGGSDEITTFTQENYNASLNAQWEIDLWGKLRQGRLAGKRQYLSAKYNYTYIQFSLTAEAAKLYFAIIEGKQLVENSEQKHNNAKIIYDLYVDRYKKGIIKSNFLQQSEIILNTTRNDLENKKSVLNTLIRQSKVLIQEYPSLTLSVSNTFPEYVPSIPIVLPADIIQRRPDLIASQYNMLAAKALNKQAMRSLYPTFSLTSGSPASSSNELEDLLEENFKVWNRGLTIFAPVFNSGKLIANKKIAKNQKEIAMLQFVNDLLNAYGEVESNLELDNTASSSLNLVKKNVEIAQSMYDTTLNEFNRGVASVEDVINANNMLFDSKNILATTEKIRIEQRINLILSLGGGFTYK